MAKEIEQSIMDTIQNICTKLSSERAAMKDVGMSLGARLIMESIKMQANIAPSIPGVEEIQVIGEDCSDNVSHVELRLTEDGPLSLKTLESKYGASQAVPRTSHSTGARAGIKVDISGEPYTCMIVVTLTKTGKSVTSLTIRRDKRLQGTLKL